jgi:uncharacterized LabA/DUF88 family protein/cold shock CspA family protein
MENEMKNIPFIKIGVAFDGQYFYQVNSFYYYQHPRRQHISFKGLHDFIRNEVALQEGSDYDHCPIVASHSYRGRLNASEASQRGELLYVERVIEDSMMAAGITWHYTPIRTFEGVRTEKGIDVMLALDTYEMAMHKQYDVLVLIASDGDFVPLVKKIQALGTRVMVLGWEFEYFSDNGQSYVTKTSQDLLDASTYPVPMHDIMEKRLKRNSLVVDGIFLNLEALKPAAKREVKPVPTTQNSEILSLKAGYGFIKWPPSNVFFHYSELINADSRDLQVGDKVNFRLEKNERGDDIAKEVSILD